MHNSFLVEVIAKCVIGGCRSCRPLSQAGRPVSGFLRPGTQSGKPSSMEQAIKAPRTAMTARYFFVMFCSSLMRAWHCLAAI